MAKPSDYITPVSGLQYYIVMVDFGRGRGKPSGFGANVEPEMTRREIVEEVRDCIANGRQIVHVKFVNGNDLVDVTHEIIAEAIAEADILVLLMDGRTGVMLQDQEVIRLLRGATKPLFIAK